MSASPSGVSTSAQPIGASQPLGASTPAPTVPGATDLIQVSSPMLPVAEPGTSTSEFKITVAAIVAEVGAGAAVLADFGVQLSAQQRTDILLFVAGGIPLLAGAYAFARSIRKRGTTA